MLKDHKAIRGDDSRHGVGHTGLLHGIHAEPGRAQLVQPLRSLSTPGSRAITGLPGCVAPRPAIVQVGQVGGLVAGGDDRADRGRGGAPLVMACATARVGLPGLVMSADRNTLGSIPTRYGISWRVCVTSAVECCLDVAPASRLARSR